MLGGGRSNEMAGNLVETMVLASLANLARIGLGLLGCFLLKNTS